MIYRSLIMLINCIFIYFFGCYVTPFSIIELCWIFSLLFGRSIQMILKYPPTRNLSGDERQLLWKFRFSLMSEKRALTKFLRCVEWSDIQVSSFSILLPLQSLLFELYFDLYIQAWSQIESYISYLYCCSPSRKGMTPLSSYMNLI